MGASFHRGFRWLSLLPVLLAALPASADEIRLKDGKRLYGVIVAYEENMFKVKTDFGYVLVEKDKIASIIPTAPAPSESQPPAKAAADSKSSANSPAKSESTSPSNASPSALNASAKDIIPSANQSKTTGKISAAVKPNAPSNSHTSDPSAPPLKGNPATTDVVLPTTPASPPPPKESDAPAIREQVHGNVYTNYTHGFRMYKPPSWQPLDDARNALPNAIVAMGASDESTLLVVGREKTKEPLESAAVTVEKRLHEVYENYQRVSQRKAVVAGSPAIEFRYRGKADDHDWSGTLVVISHAGDIFTALGMTYADSDLMQIQENVIAKTINSLSFDVPDQKP